MNLKRLARRAVSAAVAGTVAFSVGMVSGADAGAGAPRTAAPNGVPVALDLSPSSSVHLTIAVTKPTRPRSPTATPRNTRVKLAWLRPSSTGGAAINRYAVQRSRTGTSNWKTIAYRKRRAFAATGLHNGVRYYFRIRAHNAAGWSIPSRVVSAVPRTVPGAPTGLVATPGDGTTKLSWNRPANNGATIDKYAVQQFDTAASQWKTIASPTIRTHTVGSLTNGTKYSFRVLAHNRAGWSPASPNVDAVPRTTPSAPHPCLASQPDGPGSHQMQIVWFPPQSDGGAPVLLYRVEIWYGPLLTDVYLWAPAVNKYNNNVHEVWVPKLGDYWQAKVFALNEASPLVAIDQPQPGASCLAGWKMES